jgi:chaperonin cofactor prefoldin
MGKPPAHTSKPVVYRQPEFEETTLETLEKRIAFLEAHLATIERQMLILRKKEKEDAKLASSGL